MPTTAAPSMTDPFASAAAYRAVGWVGTVPVPHGVKWPPPTGFTGAGGRWPTTDDLTEWAKAAPQNIALRLPPNVIALDIDSVEGFAALVGRLGQLPATWRAHSDSGRVGHLYYRLPAGVTSEGWQAPCVGVDLLRHAHRYSVVWPSLHPSGSIYAWARPDGSDSGGEIPGPGALPELPAEWIAHLSGELRPEAVEPGEQRPRVEGLGSAIPHGAHQSELFRYAASLRARGVPEVEAEALVNLRGRQDCSPPWGGPDSPWDAVRHAYRYEEGQPAAPGLTLVGGPVPALAALQQVERPRLTFLNWHELQDSPALDVDWLVAGILAAGRGHVLYGGTGVGKSLVTLELAAAVSRGVPVLGAATRRAVVLYVDHENDPRGDVWARLLAMGYAADELVDLHYLSFPEMEPLDTIAGGAHLLQVAREVVGAEFVIVDTATRTVRGEENSNDTWTAWDRYTGVALRRAGIGFLRVDHSGKDSDRGARGASNKATDVDLIWQLAKMSENEFILINEKKRILLAEERIAFRRELNPRLHSVRINADDTSMILRQQKAVWEALDESGLSVDATRAAARAVLNDVGIKARNDVLGRVLSARKAQANAFATRPDWAPQPIEGCLVLARPIKEGE